MKYLLLFLLVAFVWICGAILVGQLEKEIKDYANDPKKDG